MALDPLASAERGLSFLETRPARLAAAEEWRAGRVKIESHPVGVSMGNGAQGTWEVLVNNRACENRQTCIDVCPTDVFEMRQTTVRHPLFWLKIKAHGGDQAVPVREESCIGCMECVTACPELAITVTQRGAVSAGATP